MVGDLTSIREREREMAEENQSSERNKTAIESIHIEREGPHWAVFYLI